MQFLKTNWQVVAILIFAIILSQFLIVHTTSLNRDSINIQSQTVKLPTDIGYILP